MPSADSPTFLRRVLAADAASCIASGALQLATLDAAPSLLHLPAWLWTGSGVFLIAYGLLVAWLAWQPAPPRTLVALCAAGNVLWAVACVAAVVVFAPTTWGIAWIGAQAACVLVLAELQWMGLRGLRRGGGMARA